MPKDNETLKELRTDLRYLWIHRHGNETPAAISDTIDALYPKLKPLIVKRIKLSETVWRLLVTLPPGLGYAEFKRYEQLFADATGGHVEITKHGKTVMMEVLTEELKIMYPFTLWDPSNYDSMYLPIPFGMSATGIIVRDLTDFPHCFIAGETNFGKSNMLHVIANSIILNRPETMVYIIDLKRTEFSYLRDYALCVSELKEALTVLKALNSELDKRLKILEFARCVKIQKYLKKGGEMPFVVLIVDELAELKDKACQESLERLGRLGRACGIHLVAATQRPSSKLYETFGDIKALFACRMCFLVADAINSNMVLDSDRAAYLPAIKGRAIYKWGLDIHEVQTLFLDPDDAEEMLTQKFGSMPKVVNPFADLDESSKMLPPRQRPLLPAGKGRSARH